jgi:hypothetical protein
MTLFLLDTINTQVTQNGLSVVLDLAAGAFVKPGPLVEVAADLLGRAPADLARGLGERDLRALSRELKGVRVVVERAGAKTIRKTIWGLSKVRGRGGGAGELGA